MLELSGSVLSGCLSASAGGLLASTLNPTVLVPSKEQWRTISEHAVDAPIGVRIAKYLDVPSSSQGPTIDPAKGYRVQDWEKVFT